MPTKRTKKLIEARLQLRFVGAFASLAAVAVLVQTVTINYTISQLVMRMPHDGAILLQHLPSTLGTSLGISILLLVPLSIAVGVMMTFPIVGPIYRFKQFLADVATGASGPCKIRKGDELEDLCELLNAATESQRASNERAAASPADKAELLEQAG